MFMQKAIVNRKIFLLLLSISPVHSLSITFVRCSHVRCECTTKRHWTHKPAISMFVLFLFLFFSLLFTLVSYDGQSNTRCENSNQIHSLLAYLRRHCVDFLFNVLPQNAVGQLKIDERFCECLLVKVLGKHKTRNYTTTTKQKIYIHNSPAQFECDECTRSAHTRL